MEKITTSQALTNLYNASKLAHLTADQHALLSECEKIINEAITPKPETPVTP